MGARTNLFFLAQTPYTPELTLRQQVAYPVWDERLTTELTDIEMHRLFVEAHLEDVWEERKHYLDHTDIEWATVLSLGEQQRLAFARLFWHCDWHERHGNGQGFYAVLDESTASMDVDSEMAVYSRCVKKGITTLSVAHRPTVIKYHHKVLVFKVDGEGELTWEELLASELSK